MWNDTILEKSIAGKKSTLSDFTIEKVREYAKKVLSSNNIFFYVTGAVTEDDIIHLSDMVGKYELVEGQPIRTNVAQIPSKFYKRDGKVKIKKDDYCSIRYSFDFDSKELPKAQIDLLYDILFDGECSKIHEELSEKTGYVYSYSSSLEQYNNIGNMYFSYEIDEKNLIKSVERVINLLKSLKEDIGEALNYVKPTYVDNGDMDLDEPEKLNWIMAYEGHILEQGYEDIDARKKVYNEVTSDEIRYVANKIFQSNNLVVTVKLPMVKDKVKDKRVKSKDIKK